MPSAEHTPPGGEAAASRHRVGLVADTHGLFRPALEDCLRGVELVLHAGDVGSREVLKRLRRLAPVVAVCGNVDRAVMGLCLPEMELVELHGLRVVVVHAIGPPDFTTPALRKALDSFNPGVVLHGHTHRPDLRRAGGVLYVNPGSCGPRRLDLPIACGILTLTEQTGAPAVEARVLELHSGRVLLRVEV
jgi:hypothetical protein